MLAWEQPKRRLSIRLRFLGGEHALSDLPYHSASRQHDSFRAGVNPNKDFNTLGSIHFSLVRVRVVCLDYQFNNFSPFKKSNNFKA
jgi:hypothetical protein